MNSSRRLAKSFLPSAAVLELTYKCNHNCLFCSCPWLDDKNDFDIREELNLNQWKEIIDKSCDMGITSFSFTGGDPLMKDCVIEIIEYTANKEVEYIKSENGILTTSHAKPNMYLITNGKAMTDEILDLCLKHNMDIGMSLPGLESFKTHTGGDVDTILNWFKKANQKGVTTTVGITVTALNIDELFETISTAFIAGADRLLLNRFLPGGRGIKHADKLSITADQIVQMLDTAEEVLKLANRYGSVGTELPKCIIGEKEYKRLEVGTTCAAARGFFVIDPSGYIRNCNHSPIRLQHYTNINDTKLDPYWKFFTTRKYLPKSCLGCKYMHCCDGGCREAAHIIGGNIDSLDPVLIVKDGKTQPYWQ